MLNITNYLRNANQTTMRYQFTPVRMATIKIYTRTKFCRGCGEKGTLLHCWWDCKLVQTLWKTVWRKTRKLNIELPFDPTIPLLGIYPEKTTIRKDTCTAMFIAALFIIAKTWKQPKCPSTDNWIKMWCLYTIGILLSHSKNKIMPFAATWMELETLILSEISQKEKDKYHTISLISGQNFHSKIYMYPYAYSRSTHSSQDMETNQMSINR